jgi:hypothetical protein
VCSLHDAVAIDRIGVPAVALISDQFRNGAATVARMRGADGYRFTVVQHPLGSLNEERLWERAEEAYPQIVAIATGQPLPGEG